MDERYWIVKDCAEALRNKPWLHIWRRELDVKFLQLRVELLKCESDVADAAGLMPFQELNLLVQTFPADGHAKETWRNILLKIDELLEGVQKQAGNNSSNY